MRNFTPHDVSIIQYWLGDPALQSVVRRGIDYIQNNIGWAYYKKGERLKALEYYQKAVFLKPDFGLAYFNMGLVYRDNQQTAEAIAAMRSAFNVFFCIVPGSSAGCH